MTSESVTEGHPDKICDLISDRILDELLRQNPMSRCAAETTVEPGAVHIMGEITSSAVVDYEAIARKCIAEIGYTKWEYGFDANHVKVTCSIHRQSPDIAMGVSAAEDGNKDVGAGDQGMMFGYATNKTELFLPLPLVLAHDLTRKLAEMRRRGGRRLRRDLGRVSHHSAAPHRRSGGKGHISCL